MSSENEIDKPQEQQSETVTPEPKAEEQQPIEPKEVKEPVSAEAGEAPEEAVAEKPAKPARKAVTPKASAEEGAAAEPSADGEAKPKAKPAAAAAKAAPAKKEEVPPPPPEPGRYAQLLMANGFKPVPLGNDAGGIEMIELNPSELREACQFLRDSDASRFDLLVSIAGVDWKTSLQAVYHLYSTATYQKLAIKATAVDDKLPSVESVWITADWHERETYDLFGIIFEGHHKLERILMPADWIGHPMRKDYKVEDPRLVWNER